MRFRYTLQVLLATAVSMAGCALETGNGNPRPNIALNQAATRTISMRVAPEVQREFSIPERDGLPSADIHEWRDTLYTGFCNGFHEYFKVIPGNEKSDLVLKISRTDVVLAYWVAGGGVRTQITYKALLLDENGQTLGVSANTVTSKTAFHTVESATDSVTSAVESMYESIARDLFMKKE
jgi:hypothetical protein